MCSNHLFGFTVLNSNHNSNSPHISRSGLLSKSSCYLKNEISLWPKTFHWLLATIHWQLTCQHIWKDRCIPQQLWGINNSLWHWLHVRLQHLKIQKKVSQRVLTLTTDNISLTIIEVVLQSVFYPANTRDQVDQKSLGSFNTSGKILIQVQYKL